KLVVETEFITNSKVRQLMYFPSDEEKLPLLLGLLSRSEGARTMVFVNTKAFVERVARALEKAGYRVGVLSGDVPQKKRESLLKKFQAGQLEILVATDVAARGLHIDGVSHVYNYDLPFDAEDYVHRIGRTARLGAEGDAISFACERYAMSLPDIEAYIEQKLPVAAVEPDLLVAVPRAPREVPAGGDVEAEESIGAIFKEAREQRAADEERRGGGRSRGGRSGGSSSGGRREGGSREGARASGPRRERASGESQAPRPPRAEKPAVQQATPAPAAVPVADAERAPRKRRRRRGGRRIEGAEGATQAASGPVNVQAKPAASSGAASKPGLFARIGHGLKKLITRAPSSQH
ncbi:MAG TPA: ATP-dependent RNA helicase RhlB, partial [Lysobacter sp.]|nr:ATP-dependent RNA helicase RhlB [Lysobacter sp.]